MIRRVIPAAVLAAVVALSTLHNASGAADEIATRAAATPVEVPGTIDATGGRDVTAELNRFLATIRADATVAFPDHGRFRIEGSTRSSCSAMNDPPTTISAVRTASRSSSRAATSASADSIAS